MSNNKYYIDTMTDINNKIWAYKIIYQQEPNTVILPSKIYEAAKLEIDNLKQKIIVCDDFKEIKCISIIKGLE